MWILNLSGFTFYFIWKICSKKGDKNPHLCSFLRIFIKNTFYQILSYSVVYGVLKILQIYLLTIFGLSVSLLSFSIFDDGLNFFLLRYFERLFLTLFPDRISKALSKRKRQAKFDCLFWCSQTDSNRWLTLRRGL